jgi:hypothetical protein
MTEAKVARERLAWIALVTALATSASWLAAIAVFAMLQSAGGVPPAVLVAVRALSRVAWLLARQAAAVAPLVLLVPGLVILFVRTVRSGSPLREEERHA